LKKAADNSYAGKRLESKLEGLWRYRAGKYRIIYLIDEKETAVVFLEVGLRKSIYE
jgi:mRNA interferase RelE/StbE